MKKPIALITGASSGLGAALANELSSHGYELILTARRLELLEKVKAQVEECGSKARVLKMDVTDYDQTARQIVELDEACGGLDLVIANAGIGAPERAATMSWDKSRNMLLTNILGSAATLLPLVPRMVERKRGHLVGISSLAAEIPIPGGPTYGASKSALSFLLLSLREELRQAGVYVSVVHPGFMGSPMTEKNKFNMPFIMPFEKGARIIMKGLQQRKVMIRFPWQLAMLSGLNGLIPARLRDRIVLSQLKNSK